MESLSSLEPPIKCSLSLNCDQEDLRERQTTKPKVLQNGEQVDDGEVGRRHQKISQQILERKSRSEAMEEEEEEEAGNEDDKDSDDEVDLQLKPALLRKYEIKQPQTPLKPDGNSSDSLRRLLPPIKLLLRQISKPEGLVKHVHSPDEDEESSMDDEEAEEKDGAMKRPQAMERQPGAVSLVEQIGDDGFPERRSLSEERLGKGSPLCEKLRQKIVEQFSHNVPQRKIAKNLGIALSTVHNIIKRFRESGQISVRKGQGRKPILTGCDVQALRQHCLENKLDSVVEITAWAQKRFGKTLSVNTVRRCIHKC